MRASMLLASLVVVSSAAVLAIGCSSADPAPAKSSSHKPGSSTGDGTADGTGDGTGSGTGDGTGQQPSGPGTPVQGGTWADGKQLAASVSIPAGTTVEIAPGATITAAAGVAITVQGTLHVKADTTHAKITGTNWAGIVVAKGGTLDVDGLDIVNADPAISTKSGNTNANVVNALLDNVGVPFKMEPGSKLSIAKSKVKATSSSAIAGALTMSYVDYDKSSAEGLELDDAAGSMTISDSVLHGVGGGDFIVSRAGALVKVEYTTITGAHCGFHFDDVKQYSIDHVSDDTNSWGAMLYGSGAGPNVISNSNFRCTDKNLDMQNTNGPVTLDHVYTSGKNVLQSNLITTKNATTSVNTDAKPR